MIRISEKYISANIVYGSLGHTQYKMINQRIMASQSRDKNTKFWKLSIVNATIPSSLYSQRLQVEFQLIHIFRYLITSVCLTNTVLSFFMFRRLCLPKIYLQLHCGLQQNFDTRHEASNLSEIWSRYHLRMQSDAVRVISSLYQLHQLAE